MHRKSLGIVRVDFDATGQLLTVYLPSSNSGTSEKKMGIQWNSASALYRLQES